MNETLKLPYLESNDLENRRITLLILSAKLKLRGKSGKPCLPSWCPGFTTQPADDPRDVDSRPDSGVLQRRFSKTTVARLANAL